MVLIILLIYIIGFFLTHWMVGPSTYIDAEDNVDDPAQKAIALLWPITLPIFIVSILVSIVRQFTLSEIYGQFYVLPTIKVTYDKLLNGDKEIILCWLKWELILAL